MIRGATAHFDFVAGEAARRRERQAGRAAGSAAQCDARGVSQAGQVRALLQTAQANPKLMETLKKVAQETEAKLFGPLLNWRNQGLPLAHGWTKMANCSIWGSDYMTRAITEGKWTPPDVVQAP